MSNLKSLVQIKFILKLHIHTSMHSLSRQIAICTKERTFIRPSSFFTAGIPL
jgi:hypothetical protein